VPCASPRPPAPSRGSARKICSAPWLHRLDDALEARV
jgi:hypothetical protein